MARRWVGLYAVRNCRIGHRIVEQEASFEVGRGPEGPGGFMGQVVVGRAKGHVDGDGKEDAETSNWIASMVA